MRSSTASTSTSGGVMPASAASVSGVSCQEGFSPKSLFLIIAGSMKVTFIRLNLFRHECFFPAGAFLQDAGFDIAQFLPAQLAGVQVRLGAILDSYDLHGSDL